MKYKVKDTTNIRNNYGIGVLSARGVENIQHFLNPTAEHSLQDWRDLDNIREA